MYLVYLNAGISYTHLNILFSTVNIPRNPEEVGYTVKILAQASWKENMKMKLS